MRYAAGTNVAVHSSKTEIERTITKYGATTFVAGTIPGGAVIAFEANHRRVQFDLPLPEKESFRSYKRGRWATETERTDAQVFAVWEQACRQRWRALSLVIKAKLEAVESGITSFDEEFLSHIVLPGAKGTTVAKWMLPQLEDAYATGHMPPLLTAGRK